MLTVVSVAVMTLLSGCKETEKAHQDVIRPVKLIEVQAAADKIRYFPAVVAAHKPAELAFRVSGVLTELALKEGQQVDKGQVLAQLDDRDARHSLANAEADYELAQLDHRRKQKLLENNLISLAEVDVAKAQLKSSKAALALAKNQLEYTQITAPFSGVVAKVHTDNYQMVQATQVILTLQRDDLMELKAQIPESLLIQTEPSSLEEQMRAFARFELPSGETQPMPLSYMEHSSVASTGSQTYEVTYAMTPPAGLNVIAGMSAELGIDRSRLLMSSAASVVVPIDAVEHDDAAHQAQVWVFNPATGRVSPHSVTLGKLNGKGIEITAGLEAGTQIVASGIALLSPDQQVKALSWPRGI